MAVVLVKDHEMLPNVHNCNLLFLTTQTGCIDCRARRQNGHIANEDLAVKLRNPSVSHNETNSRRSTRNINQAIRLALGLRNRNTTTMLHITPNIQIPLAELQFTFARSGGPGGQNVNKVNSKAVLHWDVLNSESLPGPVKQRFLVRYRNRITKEGLLVMHSQRYRDQASNVADCQERLRVMTLEIVAPPVSRRLTKPSKGAKQRRLTGKKETSQKKERRRRPNLGD